MTIENIESRHGIYQIRIYELSRDKKAVFHHRFKTHAMRIMQRYNFEFCALWECTSTEKLEFVYLLKWPNIETMERQWKLFLADNEWIEIKRRTAAESGEPVLQVTSRMLQTVEYSPMHRVV